MKQGNLIRISLCLFLCFFILRFQSCNSDSRHFHEFLNDESKLNSSENPEWATTTGYSKYNDRWSDLSLSAFSRRDLHTKDALSRLLEIDKTKLNKNDRLSYDLFVRDLKLRIKGQRFKRQCLRINQLNGIQESVVDTLRRAPKKNKKDFTDILARLRTLPELVDNTVILLKEGIKTGITVPKITLRAVPEQIKAMTAAEDNPLMEIFKSMPDSISLDRQQEIKEEAHKALIDQVIPSFKKLNEFIVNEYIPHARDTIGWCDLPDGREWYTHLVKDLTSMDMTPEEIHSLGLSEVKRIRGEIESLMKDIGFEGSYGDFLSYMLTDKQFFFENADNLVNYCRDMAKRADSRLPEFFGKLPKLSYKILPVPALLQKSAPSAYFSPGNVRNNVSSVFYINTYNLAFRPKWGLTPIVLHEAVPGHYLQLTLRAERKHSKIKSPKSYMVYIEGWALYAETLGYEMGMYQDQYSRFGQYNNELWRAVRLVVDTGIHWYGWSRDQAVKYCRDNVALSDHNISVEVDRYIVWPAQALTCKIGQLKIKECRDYCQSQLKDKFEIRAFHDFVLGQGPLPMDVLGQQVKDWVAENK